MQHKYHNKAVCAGVHVVGTCGFDSIPADMGVVFTQESFPGAEHLLCSYSQQLYRCFIL